MPTREEIREGTKELLSFIYAEQQGAKVRDIDITVLFSYLQSKGVVIRHGDGEADLWVEPLIEGE